MSSKGYLALETRVSDPVAYECDKALAKPVVVQYGGRDLALAGSGRY